MKVLKDGMPDFARDIAARIEKTSGTARPGAYIVALQGELGSGKTTFMQHFARELKIQDTVHSPTFVLMQIYAIDFAGFTRLVHIDAYRLESAGEFEALRPSEFLRDPHALVCIEWPEKVEGALPVADMLLKFNTGEGESERDIEVEEK